MTKRVLVTGANGFVGRRVLGPLLARGFDVHAVGRSVPPPVAGGGSAALISAEDVTWHKADLLDTAQRRALMATVRASHLLHFAWYAEPGAFWAARENAAWVSATIGLVDEFAAAGGARATLAGVERHAGW